MAATALRGARIFDGERFVDHHAVVIDGEWIVGLVPESDVPADLPCQDLGGGTLAPGYVDAQVNGGGGVLFNDTTTAAGVAAVAQAHARFGTTGLLPTFITDRSERRRAAVAAVRDAIRARSPGVLGIHLEGPFLSVARKGAHDPALIRPMSDRDVDEVLDTGLRTVLLTVAAENASPEQIRRLTDGGVIVSIGHSDASYEVASAAADAGARCVTHLFNAMSPLGHRAPGVVGAALDHPGFWGGLIADGHHVHPAALRSALRAKRGPGRLFLVSDAMPPAGSPGDHFTLSGRGVTRRDGALTFDDGTLAGADLTLDEAVRYSMAHLDQPLDSALRMASLYPAQMLRLDDLRGRLAPKYCADMILLGDDVTVRRVWIGGLENETSPI